MTTSTESRGLPFIVATFLGVGLSPVAPGTVGSVAALPLAVLLLHWPILFSSATLVVLFMLGTWCANHLERATGLHDAQIIVIDEVVGQCLTLLILGTWFLTHIDPYVVLALSFVSFRLIDILKPWPVSWLDQQVGGGLGVMIDDVAAALIAAGLVAGGYSLMQLAWSAQLARCTISRPSRVSVSADSPNSLKASIASANNVSAKLRAASTPRQAT